ncbi:Outer membrane protein Imp, required for envelope biogenesis / Organic solvent tolerance protein precursor [hydrothermal vent metagenome]|uniref:Outer membrane protein Imp, required for envelope biogenesis / Organic solvent tolerance protein n=1 Tax=hydrothermal vent metagenome TaxID=652676 RepID=A0A3B1DSA6_9ZZZZ
MFNNIYIKILSILLFTINIYGNKLQKEEKLQILAKTITTKGNIIIASGDVLIHSSKYYITAQKVLYNKDKSTLELFDNVHIVKNGKTITLSNYVFLNFAKEVDKLTPVLFLDHTNDVWINSKQGNRKKDILNFNKSTLSSCDCYDPAWSLNFTSGDYNKTQQWLNLYNTTLFINKIPIFYMPYFGFSTNESRRTGLLKPTFGWSNTEGFLYIQPFFYAPQLNWDIEYIAQARTKRGNGHNFKYRLKDSDVSLLTIKTGIFQEYNSYFQESNLRHSNHYGVDLDYKRDTIFSRNKLNTQDGLLVSLHRLNDIDYINTQNYQTNHSINKFVESKINYFYNNSNIYSDINFKYYQDMSKINNDDTMYALPRINFHKYSSETFIDNLFYSSDVKYTNEYREKGLNGKLTSVVVPFTYNNHLLNKYLTMIYSEQFTLKTITYDNNYNNGQFLENKHIFALSTHLFKPYTNYLHAISIKTSLIIPNSIKESGDLYSVTSMDENLSVFPMTKTKKNMTFAFNQSIYDKKKLSHILNHKINQSIIYDENGVQKLSDLENEVVLYYKYGQLYNRSLFNHQSNVFISSSTSASFKKNNFNSTIYYNYSKDTSKIGSNTNSYSYEDLPKNKSLTYHMDYKFSKYYTVGYNEQYDLETNISKRKEYTLKINKKCWALNLKLASNLVATATTNNSAIRENVLYMQMILKPILTIDQKYIQKRTNG